jgi:transposase InsO family protein
MIGPWPVQYESSLTPGKTSIEKIQALKIIDKATGWPEFIVTRNKSSYHISILFDNDWLCCYPHPQHVIHDNGTEFTGSEFQELLSSYGIKAKSTSVHNPKSNGVIEYVHLMDGMLCTIMFSGNDWLRDLQRTLDASRERNKITAASNSKENNTRIAKDYKVGEKILLALDAEERRGQPKMDMPTRVPFHITPVHDNGTVTINRRIKPYHTG